MWGNSNFCQKMFGEILIRYSIICQTFKMPVRKKRHLRAMQNPKLVTLAASDWGHHSIWRRNWKRWTFTNWKNMQLIKNLGQKWISLQVPINFHKIIIHSKALDTKYRASHHQDHLSINFKTSSLILFPSMEKWLMLATCWEERDIVNFPTEFHQSLQRIWIF